MPLEIVINLKRAGDTSPAGNYNNVSGILTAGQKVADLIDFNTGAATGASFHIDTPFSHENAIAASTITTAYHGLDELFWEPYGYSNATVVTRIAGLPANKSYTLEPCGWGNSATRHTDFSVNGGAAERYTNGSTPSAPPVMSVTSSGTGELTITATVVDSYLYNNGYRLKQVATPGIAAETIQLDGVTQASLTGVKVRVTAGQTTLNGAEYYSTTTATTDASGVLAAIDLSSSAAVVGDPVLLHILTADGKGGVFPVTVGAI